MLFVLVMIIDIVIAIANNYNHNSEPCASLANQIGF